MKIVALEEHVAIPEVLDAWLSIDPSHRDFSIKAATEGETSRRLLDLGTDRITSMDEAGIDVQVISLTSPGVQNLTADRAVQLATMKGLRRGAEIYLAWRPALSPNFLFSLPCRGAFPVIVATHQPATECAPEPS